MNTSMEDYCCEKFAELADPGDNPPAQFVRADDGEWCIHGCCGGHCYVVVDMKFCPFCGTKLEAPARRRIL